MTSSAPLSLPTIRVGTEAAVHKVANELCGLWMVVMCLYHYDSILTLLRSVFCIRYHQPLHRILQVLELSVRMQISAVVKLTLCGEKRIVGEWLGVGCFLGTEKKEASVLSLL